MQTSFTEAQLQDPHMRQSKEILGTCVHLGFCTNTCPTYVLTRDENESPRGRIDLIKAMLEKGGRPEAKTVKHLDSCLSCLSCMTTCAVKVDYAHLIDHARTHIEQNYRRPLSERVLRSLLAAVIPRPRIFGAALWLGRLGRYAHPVLPRRWRPLIDIIPKRTSIEIIAPAVFPAEGVRRKRVALLAGCAQQVLNADINAATIRLLRRHGCEVVVASGAGCCGSLPLHMGRERSAHAMARANIRAWIEERDARGLDAIVVNASGCGTMVKDYGHQFHHDDDIGAAAREIAALAKDVTEILAELGLSEKNGLPAYKVAYHDPCSMQHGQKVTGQPRSLLKAAGLNVTDIPEKHFCCGSAGTYNLLQPDTARQLGERKAGHIASTGPDLVATGNIGCMTQIQQYCDLPILHTAQILDWATGGPRPTSLNDIILREPQPEPQVDPAPAIRSAPPASEPEGGDSFW